jgi:hypothetical protein
VQTTFKICTNSGKKDDGRKTRASVNKPDSGSVNNSGRIIKGTAITSKKPNKRKGAKSNISNYQLHQNYLIGYPKTKSV